MFIIVVVYFVIDSVRKLLDAPSYVVGSHHDYILNRPYIQVEVFWVVTPCGVAVGYRLFGGPCCLHLAVRCIYSVLHISGTYRSLHTLNDFQATNER